MAHPAGLFCTIKEVLYQQIIREVIDMNTFSLNRRTQTVWTEVRLMGKECQEADSPPHVTVAGPSNISSFAEAVKGFHEKPPVSFPFRQQSLVDLHKIVISLRSEQNSYPSVSITPEYRASLEVPWRKGLICKMT